MKKRKLADVRKELRAIESELTHLTIKYVAFARPDSLATYLEREAVQERVIALEERVIELNRAYPKAKEGPKP